MTEQEVFIRISAELMKNAGPARMNAGAVMQGILKDFSRMAAGAGRLRRVCEEYRTDDGRYTVRLAGEWNGREVVYEEPVVLRH